MRTPGYSMNSLCARCGGLIDAPRPRTCLYCGAVLASQITGGPKSHTKPLRREAINVFLIVVGGLALLMFITAGQAPHFVEQQASIDFTLAPCLCATSLEDAGSVLAAYSMSDSTTLTNLVAHGKAFSLPEGVQLHIVSRRDRISRVRIESGTHTNEHCWIPAGLIGDRTSTELRGRRRPIRRRG
jgi:hypothetical protein